MPRRRALRLTLAAIAVLVVLVLLATVVVAIVLIRRPLPEHSGTHRVPGLSAEVTVHRDALGVPYISADTPHDLFFAQGYVHAQDRFFEMDYRRHVTAGRLSELVGANEQALAADKVIRTFGWRRVAEQEWDLISQSTREHLQSYADGVNAYLAQRDAGSLGVEYTVLGLQVDVADPEPWDPIDSLAWLKAMAWDLRGNYDHELERGLAYTSVRDVERVDELFPPYPYEDHAPIVVAPNDGARTVAVDDRDGDVRWGSADLERALAAASEALDAVPSLIGTVEGVGSNSWVVAGEYTASGSPILANDPHLAISAPGIWSQIGLRCRQVDEQCPFDVTGFSFAGFPGVIIGHNGDLAWGLTNMGADVTDFFIERTYDNLYLRDGEREPMAVRVETIEVNGGPPVTLEVRSTVHGPIISGVLADEARLGSAPVPERPLRGTATHEIALAWTALEPGRTADAVFAINTATNAEDIAAAAAMFAVPAQNIVFATADGDIGYQAPGRIPVRLRVNGPVPSDGTWPRPGWDSRYDWQGYVDPEDLPAALNPPEGFIVAANQAVTPEGVGPHLTHDYDYGYRAARIRELLEAAIDSGTPLDVPTMNEIQLDEWNPLAELLVPVLLSVRLPDSFTNDGVELLRDWDHVQGTDSAAAAYLMAVWDNLLELTFHDEIPAGYWPSGGSRSFAVVEALLEDPTNAWWDDRTTVNIVETRDEILSQALTEARLELTRKLGKDTSDWQWGLLHQAAPQHAVLGGDDIPRPVRELVNPRPVPVGGGSSIVNATAWDAAGADFTVTAAPTMRKVVDLGNPDASTWVTMTGTSAHPGSTHYTDQLSAWANGETFPWPFTPEAVTTGARELRLVPAP